MDNRNNTIAGWVLFAGICALGLTIGSGMLFASHDPHKPGYPIEDAEGGEGGGGKSAVPLPNLLAAADVAKGEAVFAKCAACHTINQGGANGIGPNLYGIVGGPHDHAAGFSYSEALLAFKGKPWTWDELSAWLKSPKTYANGTKMAFAGIAKPDAFFASLRAQGLHPVRELQLGDHASALAHPELAALLRAPGDAQLLCTEKDAVKLWPQCPHLLAVPLQLQLPADLLARVDARVDEMLARGQGGSDSPSRAR